MIGVASGAVPIATLDAALVVASAGFVLAQWIFPDDEPAVATDGGEELFDDDGADDLDMDGDGLDGLELDDGDDLDGDLGGDLGGDDSGLDAGGSGGAEPDLEPRVDELEAQIENVSGQVSSAQHESEELNEAIDRIEDNVRQLLDIYALVTKGANPFTDDSGGPMDMDIGESLDIFDTDEDQDLDDEVEGEMADTDDMLDDLDDMQEEAREELEEAQENLEEEDEAMEDEEAEDGEGTTFDDLKSEYESDEPLEEMTDEDDEEDHEAEDESAEDDPDEPEDDLDDHPPEEGFEFDNEPADVEGAKPYLVTLPDGYGTDVLVMEWLEFLVAVSGPRRAARAIDHYEALGWLGAPAADRLRAILSGPRFDGAGSDGSLSAAHHRRSLEYIARLSDGGFGDSAPMLAANGADAPRSALRPDGGDR